MGKPHFLHGRIISKYLKPPPFRSKIPNNEDLLGNAGKMSYLLALCQSTGSHVLIPEMAKSNDFLGRERYLNVFLDDVGSLGSRLHVKPCWV